MVVREPADLVLAFGTGMETSALGLCRKQTASLSYAAQRCPSALGAPTVVATTQKQWRESGTGEDIATSRCLTWNALRPTTLENKAERAICAAVISASASYVKEAVRDPTIKWATLLTKMIKGIGVYSVALNAMKTILLLTLVCN